MSKRFLSLVLALVMVLGTLGTAVFAAGPTDNEKVNWLIDQGIVTGNEFGDYMLDKTIDRASVAKMVVEALDLKAVAAGMQNYKTAFKDVPVTHWSNGNINVVSGRGLMIGNAGNFMPGNQISYAEVVTILVRMLDGLTADEEKAAVWPTTYIAKAYEMGILDGVTVASYQEPAVREAILEMFYNAMTNMEVGNYTIVKAIVLENNRVESLKKDEVVVEIIRELQKAGYVDKSRYEKGDQRSFVIPAKVGDVENLLGKVVDLTLDKNNEVVKVKIDNSYDYLTGEILATEKSVQLNWDKKYTVVLDERYKERDDRVFRTYFNNQDYKYEDFYKDPSTIKERETDREESYYAEFAKITVKDGKVLYIDAFNFDDIAPVKEVRKDGKEVIILDDNRDGSTRKLSLDADTFVIEVNAETKDIKRTSLEAIEANHVIHYMANKDYADTVFVRTDAKLEGTYEKARSSRIEGVTATNLYVDGEAYTSLTEASGRKAVYTYDLEKFATLEGTQRQIDERLDSYKDKDVVLLLDMNDNVQYIAAEVKDTHFIGLVDNILGTEIKIALIDGEKEVYVARMSSALVAYPTAGSLKEARLKDFNIGDLVRVQLDENEEIKTIVKLADAHISTDRAPQDNWKLSTYAGVGHREKTGAEATINGLLTYSANAGTVTVDGVKSYLTKDTVVFINNGLEVKGTTMADVNKGYVLENANGYSVAEAYVIYDVESDGNENIARVVVFNKISAKSAGTEKITRRVVDHEYTGGTNYLIVADESGELKTHEVKAGSITVGLVRGDIVELTVTKNDAQVITAATKLINVEKDNIYRIVRKNDRRIVLRDEVGTERYFYISINAKLFGTVEEATNVLIKSGSVTEGSLIDIVTVAPANKGVRGTFVKADDKAPVVGDYKVTAKFDIDTDTIIVLNGKAYALADVSKIVDKTGTETLNNDIPAGVDVEVTFVEGTQQVYMVKVLNFTDAELAAEIARLKAVARVATAKEALKVKVEEGSDNVKSRIVLDATLSGVNVSYKLDGAAYTLGNDIPKEAAAKEVTLVATIADSTVSTVTDTKSFTLTIPALPSNNAKLQLLRIGGKLIDLTAAEGTGTTLALEVEAGSGVLVEFKLADSKATLTSSTPIATLVDGVYTGTISTTGDVVINVKAEDGTTTQVYKVAVTITAK